MKRKLIKRNKQFMSSRYGKYGGGILSFQMLYSYTLEFNSIGEIEESNPKIYWDWCLNGRKIDMLFNIGDL